MRNAKAGLAGLLEEAGVSQREFAQGIKRSDAVVSRLVSGEAAPSKRTIDNTLAFLRKRLRRRVTYEEVWPVEAKRTA